MKFSSIIKKKHNSRSDRLPMPLDETHWTMSAASYLSAGTLSAERLSYGRACAGITAEQIAKQMRVSLRQVKFYFSGDRIPAPGASAWSSLGRALGINPAWLERGHSHIGGQYIAPDWLYDSIGLVARIYSKQKFSACREDETAARAAIERVLMTPVLAPILLGDLEAVQKAVSAKGAEILLLARATGQLIRADEMAQKKTRKTTTEG